MKKTITVTWLFLLFIVFTAPTQALIDFQGAEKDKIDLETLETDRDQFFDFLKSSIISRPAGLGKYGRVPFYPCNMVVNNRKLIDYKTLEGKEIKFLSNPSCDQIVIRKVLENSYSYAKEKMSGYQGRQCILNVEKLISPILEFYTIKYEERKKSYCNACDFKEQKRMDLILRIQKAAVQDCGSQKDSVMQFISDLDAEVEKIYKSKSQE